MSTTYTVLRTAGHPSCCCGVASRFAWYAQEKLSIAFSCGYCGVRPWQPCITKTGRRASRVHGNRDDAVRATLVAAANGVTV